MQKEYNCKLIFEDGNEYLGYSFGDRSERVCEIVFNTSMVAIRKSSPIPLIHIRQL